jgi:hypothetical protein
MTACLRKSVPQTGLSRAFKIVDYAHSWVPVREGESRAAGLLLASQRKIKANKRAQPRGNLGPGLEWVAPRDDYATPISLGRLRRHNCFHWIPAGRPRLMTNAQPLASAAEKSTASS